MACTGHTGSGFCTGHTDADCTGHSNSCPTHGGYIPAVTQTEWTDDPLDNNTLVKAIHHNELRSAIASELSRWGQSWPSDPGDVNVGEPVDNLHVRKLRDGVNAALAWSWPSHLDDVNTEDGDEIQDDQYNALRGRVNAIEDMCVCDCDYACTCDCNYACTCDCNYACTCDCNYCTCDCNYCTCDCNYCTCNCNYSCTCNCNYTPPCSTDKSDLNLKYDINYLS